MRCFAFILLLAISQHCFAEWQFLGATSDGTAYLIDPTSKKNKGQLVEMLTMQNLRAARLVNGHEFRSAVGHTLYNCADKTSATTVIRQFSGERGAGKVVGSFKQKPNEIIWDAILPNTILDKEWRVACGVG
ncbi:MAG: surface-adhesin E family protein [Betaproteobacteria bacterium]